MAQSSIEPFPSMAAHRMMQQQESSSGAGGGGSSSRRRRASGGLGGDPRGDTGAPALATLNDGLPPSLGRSSTSPRPSSERPRGSKRRKAKTLFKRWKTLSLKHTWLMPLIACLTVVSIYLANPGPQNPVRPALFLSYAQPRPADAPDGPTLYGKGKADFAFVAFYTVFLSFTREFLMQRVIRPWAVRAGIRRRAKQARFMEQVYTAMYFALLGPFGLYVMRRGPVWYFDTRGMYEGFPHREHEAVFKAYYLVQASYWAQQMIVLLLQLEKPRKDFKELVAHHIITLSLIGLSYRFHFAHMGLAVYITHDVSDFFLATSKTLNYLNSILVEPYFVTFIGVWTYMRHYINIRILVSIFTEFRTVGPFELNWETQQYKCWISQLISFSLLAALQAVNIFWFVLIVRVALRFVRKREAVDERSEDEMTEEEEPKEENKEADGKANGVRKIEEAPVVMLNGVPVEGESGVKARRKAR